MTSAEISLATKSVAEFKNPKFFNNFIYNISLITLGELNTSHLNSRGEKQKLAILKRRLMALISFPQTNGYANTLSQYLQGVVRDDDNNINTIADVCFPLWNLHQIDLSDKFSTMKRITNTNGNLKYAEFSYSITNTPSIANARRYESRIFIDLLGAIGNRIVAIAKFPVFFRPQGGRNSGTFL